VILQKRDNRRARICQHDRVKHMKTKLYILIILLTGWSAQAQTSNLTSLLQQGLFEEQANRNLEAAISNYQSLAAQFEKDRQLAATAVFRIGECYRMEGKTNEAVAQYQRILRDFSDQAQLATLSRQNLAGLGSTASLPSATLTNSDAENLLQQEIDLIQKQLETQQQQVKVGVMSPDGLVPTQQKLIELKLQLGQLRGSGPGFGKTPAPTDEEEHEIRRIQELIQNSPDLINSGDFPLIHAARNGWLRVATYLLDHGAEVNGSQNGFAALHAAADAGNRAMVDLLLNRGADVNAVAGNSGTPLCLAAKNGFQAVIEVLLAHKADVNASTSENLETPLYLSARQHQPKTIQMLLAAGANPNLENHNGVTALSEAAGSPEIVKLLLNAKADANGGKIDVPLIAAIHARDAASTERLLQAGANPNLKSAIDGIITLPANSPGRRFSGGGGGGGFGSARPLTPLFLAVDTRQLPMVKLLLKYKADPNDTQTDGSPVWFSALADTNILESLLDAGAKADANWRRENEQTPLFSAVVANNAVAVELLLKHGANPNINTADGYTPLTAAAERLADAKVFELLLAYKADPNVRGFQGRTPLEALAIYNGNVDAAMQRRHGELADLLRKHGALDNPPNWNAITVNRPSTGFSKVVFDKETNDWNRFTLLETILNYYVSPTQPFFPVPYRGRQTQAADGLPFPNLARVTIVRPGHGTTNETRISVNLLNSTNGIDCSRDVPLEFGDAVEIPERDHSLAEGPIGLATGQYDAIANCLKGNVQLFVRDQKMELPIIPVQPSSIIVNVLDQPGARKILSSSSDLSRVKISRHNAKTGENREWIVNCSNQPSSDQPSSNQAPNSTPGMSAGNNPTSPPDLWLRDGDIINVPEKP
jgi:cytohesin